MSRPTPTRDAELTTRWLTAVAEGERIVTEAGLRSRLRWSPREASRCLQAWTAAGWLVAVPDAPRTWAVGETCPGAPDTDTLALETLLTLALPKTPPERIGFGYRTALELHGLSQEFSDGAVFICVLGTTRPPPAATTALPFQRSTAQPGEAVCHWQHRHGHVIRRDARILDQGQWERTDAGLRLTGAARTLVDCWLRPGYGVDDDRWLAAWERYWEDPRFGSPAQKIQDLLNVHRADQDPRPGRAAAFADLLAPHDPAAAYSLRMASP